MTTADRLRQAIEATGDDEDEMMDIMFLGIMGIVTALVTVATAKNVIYGQGMVSLGITEPFSVTATTEVKELRFSTAMQSVSIHNDGGYRVYIKVNTLNTNPNVINPGETFNLGYNTHAIERVFYYSELGDSEIRITGAG